MILTMIGRIWEVIHEHSINNETSQMGQGKFKTVSEAERAAGIKPPLEFKQRISLPLNPAMAAEVIRDKFGNEFADQLIKFLTRNF